MTSFAHTSHPLMKELVQTTLQLPKPNLPKHLYASSLEPKVESPEQVSPPTRLQKWQISSDGEHLKKRVQLTRKNLALFNNMAKKKGTSKASASAPPESTSESSTKTTSTTTSGFAIQAYKNGILNPLSSKPPTNLEDMRQRVAASRRTASPTESVYEDYVDAVEGAVNEATMVFEVGGKLLKEYPKKGYTRAFNQAFTGFPRTLASTMAYLLRSQTLSKVFGCKSSARFQSTTISTAPFFSKTTPIP